MALLLVLLPFVGTTAVAEDPHNRDCDGVGVLVVLCAGADGGGNGGCEDTNQAEVSCWYNYAWNLNASSPPQLPGGGRLAWSYEVTACLDGQGCTLVEAGGGGVECAWLVNELEPCLEQHMGGDELDFVLQLGQCVTVTASVTVSAQAWSVEEEDPLFHALATDSGEGGGAACYLDNGRP